MSTFSWRTIGPRTVGLRGSSVRGPTVHFLKRTAGPNNPRSNCPPLKNGQLGPGAQLSGAQLSALKKWTFGPRGPTVLGPKCLEPLFVALCYIHGGSFTLKCSAGPWVLAVGLDERMGLPRAGWLWDLVTPLTLLPPTSSLSSTPFPPVSSSTVSSSSSSSLLPLGGLLGLFSTTTNSFLGTW